MDDIAHLRKTNHQNCSSKPADWYEWKWQQRNSIKTVEGLADSLLSLPVEQILKNAKDRKIQITPYYLDLIQKQAGTLAYDRLLNQVIPFWDEEAAGGYNGQTENWELSHEMKTPVCQHKYDNRVIIRTANVCNAYCQFCFEALRTINTDHSKPALNKTHWHETLTYIKENTQLEEVIFSGGDPLMLSDSKLKQILMDVREARPDILIRVHSRALTFNPFRITDELLQAFESAGVNAFGIHICHPAEITDEFKAASRKMRNVVPIQFANIPVLKGINDDYETLTALFLSLYRNGVVPYYLYHFMPFSPGSSEYRASVADVIGIMCRIKRRKSNIAVPEYVLPHMRGKYTVPLLESQDEFPRFEDTEDGGRVYAFTNWLGERHEWRDA
ncbi:MAG: radical SAM protein [Rhodobacteraceae bacterium]|nr:radical SAM protein [Paracoccaceae bacterium]